MTTLSKEDVVRWAREAECGHETLDNQWLCPTGIRKFATLARADLVAENERLVLAIADHQTVRSDLRQKLIEVQAENERLKAIIEKQSDCEGEFCGKCYEQGLSESRTALAAVEARETKLREIVSALETKYSLNSEIRELCCPPPADDSALREMIAGVYEECAKACRKEAVVIVVDGKEERAYNNAISDCELAIRALAEKAKGE